MTYRVYAEINFPDKQNQPLQILSLEQIWLRHCKTKAAAILSLSLSLSCFNSHFSRWTWVSRFYWS